ncbi:hypothetical protein BCT47_21610 [Vibrio splendidus]|nr:hypothetical protein BCT47_21610 [Vibrio splendidus]PTO83283.1 hypothetical protein CWN93_08650 [Vibrio splendidus]
MKVTEAVKFEPCIKVDLNQLKPKTEENKDSRSTTTKKEKRMKKLMSKTLLGSMLAFTSTLEVPEVNLQTNTL